MHAMSLFFPLYPVASFFCCLFPLFCTQHPNTPTLNTPTPQPPTLNTPTPNPQHPNTQPPPWAPKDPSGSAVTVIREQYFRRSDYLDTRVLVPGQRLTLERFGLGAVHALQRVVVTPSVRDVHTDATRCVRVVGNWGCGWGCWCDC